jgi:ferredoxin-NADP reductase
MQSIYRDAQNIGIGKDQIHFEFFGPKEELAA